MKEKMAVEERIIGYNIERMESVEQGVLIRSCRVYAKNDPAISASGCVDQHQNHGYLLQLATTQATSRRLLQKLHNTYRKHDDCKENAKSALKEVYREEPDWSRSTELVMVDHNNFLRKMSSAFYYNLQGMM